MLFIDKTILWWSGTVFIVSLSLLNSSFSSHVTTLSLFSDMLFLFVFCIIFNLSRFYYYSLTSKECFTITVLTTIKCKLQNTRKNPVFSFFLEPLPSLLSLSLLVCCSPVVIFFKLYLLI